MSPFEQWWHEVGSGIIHKPGEDQEEHAKRVAAEGWNAALRKLIKDSNERMASRRLRHRLKDPFSK